MMRFPLLLLLCWTGAVGAHDAALPIADDKPLLEARARELRDQAGAMRQAAEARFAAENQACWTKFLVSGCQDEARKARIDAIDAARQVEREARAIERDLKKAEFAAHEARLAADLPRRAAEAAAQAERNRLAQRQAMERVERRRLEAEREERH